MATHCRSSSTALSLLRVVGLVVTLLSLVASSSAQYAIPERYDGFVYNVSTEQGRGPVMWEVFVDPLCIDCKNAWPVVKQVVEKYGSALLLIVHPFPAPFHHNAFFASRALHVAQMTNSSLVYPLLELIFSNQESFLNPSTNHETPAHVVSRLISLADNLGFPTNSFEVAFNDAVTDQATRISFKYGCSRGVVGTPTYLVNGVAVAGADDSWSVEDWGKLFDPMMKSPGFGMLYSSLAPGS